MRAGISNPYAGLGQGIGSLGAALIGSAGAKDSARNDRETQLLKNNVLVHQGNKLGIETDRARYEHQGLQDAAGQVQAYYADQPAYGALAEAALRGGASGDIANLQQGGFRDQYQTALDAGDQTLANSLINAARDTAYDPYTVADGQVQNKATGALGAQTLGGAAREGASRASAASSYASARNTGLQAQLRQRELDAGVGSGLPTGYRYVDPADPRAGAELVPGYTPKNGGGITYKAPDGTQITIGGSGTSTEPPGFSPLGRTPGNKAQGAAAEAIGAIAHLEAIGTDFADRHLTASGRLRRKGLELKDAAPGVLGELDEEQRGFLTEATQFKQQVETSFQLWRSQITGAAAAVAELKRLEQSSINFNDSPTVFKAKLATMVERNKRVLAVQQQLLTRGIPINSPAYNDTMLRAAQGLEADDPSGGQVGAANGAGPAPPITDEARRLAEQIANGEI